jgi:predicted alpha/beta superfamily hydrolase
MPAAPRIPLSMPTRHVVGGRSLRVWVPHQTEATARPRHPVLYLLDGQNVFDDAHAFAGRGWNADATAQRLVDRDRIEAPILVGIDNADGRRTSELTPWPWRGRGGGAASFARLLLDAIVPFVDAHYPTRAERAARAIGGASLGGLFALHLALSRPDVFGGCAALSPSLWWADGALPAALAALPHKRPVRIWLDAGRREAMPMQQGVRAVAELLLAKGWQKHRQAARADLRHVEVKGGRHDEASWGKRFDRVLKFLFPPSKAPAVRRRGGR